MRRICQIILLRVYRAVFANWLLRYQWGRRLFFLLYDTYKNAFEAGEIKGLRAFIPEGSLVIDVGANVGFFTILFANWVGKQGCVIAIEPEAQNFSELQRKVLADKYFGVVEIHNVVADRVGGEVLLTINPNHPGDHKIGNEGIAVPALTIDDLCSKLTRRLAFIKIDVQGAEMRVLLGAEATLVRDQPVLFVEVDPAALSCFGTSMNELLTFLSQLNYVPHIIERSGVQLLLRERLDELILKNGYTDILFIPKVVQ